MAERIPSSSSSTSSSSSSSRGWARAGALAAALAAAGAVLSAASPARADEPLPLLRRHRFYYRNNLAARLNPLGLFNEFRFSYRYQLFQSVHPLLRSTFVGVTFMPTLSPAFGRAGLGLEVQPLSILNLSVMYEGTVYWNAFNILQSFPSATAEHSDRRLARPNMPPPDGTGRPSYASTGTHLTLGAILQTRAGSLVARSIFRAFYHDITLRQGDTVWYDQYLDVLSPGRGWVITNDADLLISPEGGGLTFGLRYTVTHAVYGPEHFAPGEAQVNYNSPHHRMGPFLAYTFYEAWHSRFNAPAVFLIVNWYMAHRYRTGHPNVEMDGINGAIPYVAFGLNFRGDL